MALRLAGEELSVVQGLDAIGWLREIQASDALPGLKITQSGSGHALELNKDAVFAEGEGPIVEPNVAAYNMGWYYNALWLGTRSNNPLKFFINGLEKVRIETDGDIKGVGGFKTAFCFMQQDVAAEQSAVAIPVLGLAANTEIVLPFSGSVIGIAVASNDARTAGSLTVDVTVNGTATGLQAALDGSNTQYHSATQAKDTDAFAAGARLGVKITTSADWAPTTADIVVTVVIEH